MRLSRCSGVSGFGSSGPAAVADPVGSAVESCTVGRAGSIEDSSSPVETTELTGQNPFLKKKNTNIITQICPVDLTCD